MVQATSTFALYVIAVFATPATQSYLKFKLVLSKGEINPRQAIFKAREVLNGLASKELRL